MTPKWPMPQKASALAGLCCLTHGGMHCGCHPGCCVCHELGDCGDLVAIVLRCLLPEISVRNQDLIGRAAPSETLHQIKIFLHPPTHEILPLARDHAESGSKKRVWTFICFASIRGRHSVGHGATSLTAARWNSAGTGHLSPDIQRPFSRVPCRAHAYPPCAGINHP